MRRCEITFYYVSPAAEGFLVPSSLRSLAPLVSCIVGDINDDDDLDKGLSAAEQLFKRLRLFKRHYVAV